MAWFDRCLGNRDAAEWAGRLAHEVERSGLTDALALAAGPVGLRRFVVRFDQKGGRLRVTGLESEQLAGGGGPPASATFDSAASAIESGLSTLRRALPPPFVFGRGAVGVVRDADGEMELIFRFDEDGDSFRLVELPPPEGESTPVEHPDYLRALAAWQGRIAPVRERWVVPRGEWSWSEGWLDLGDQRLRADAIATWHPGQHRFEWMLEKPAGEEPPFVEPELLVELGPAMELAVFAAARLGATGIFQGALESGQTWFGGVRG